MKFEEIAEEGGEDRISKLPDCVVLEILSCLPSTTDAIRTGTLSKRWKHLWTWVPSLIFSDDNHPPWNFFSFVNETLTQCRQLKLNKFVLSTSYATLSEWKINNWIRYAIRCNVGELNLKLSNVDEGDKFLLDQCFFINSCFTDLTLEGCMLNPSGAISWKNLRSLWISEGYLNEDLIENILSGSPVLETLVLDNCYGYRRLHITSKSIKNLVLRGYYWDPPNYDDDDFLYIIEINAPNILSLTIQGDLWLWKILLLNVSSLIKANLDNTMFVYHETILKVEEEKLSHVKELKIGVLCSKVVSRLEAKGFVFPSNIKFPDVPPGA